MSGLQRCARCRLARVTPGTEIPPASPKPPFVEQRREESKRWRKRAEELERES